MSVFSLSSSGGILSTFRVFAAESLIFLSKKNKVDSG